MDVVLEFRLVVVVAVVVVASAWEIRTCSRCRRFALTRSNIPFMEVSVIQEVVDAASLENAEEDATTAAAAVPK